MSYRKFQADQIFTGTQLLDGNNVLITDQKGIIEDIVSTQDAGDDIQKFSGVLSPGLINCHCHLELSHMKGLIPEKTGLVDFVFKVITERHFSEEEILDAIAKAEDEMLINGITAVGDICNNALTLHQKLKQRLAYYNFIEVSGWLPQIAGTRFERSKSFYDEFTHSQFTTHNSQPKTSLVPHAPYSVSNELWKYIQPYFDGKTISIHNQETAFEDELFLSNAGDFVRMYEMMKIDHSHFVLSGKSSLQSYFDKLAAAKNVILVHNTFTKQEDVAFINGESAIGNQQTFFCICINANLYIENSVPAIDMLMKNNCKMVLGTDSLASNHSLNLLDEMKSITQHFPHIALQTLLQWSTINGAKALQMDDVLGSFEKGKQPGVVLIDELYNQHITLSSAVKRII
ncbi:amidohydrolase family protein [Panacibacter ginsenosidivorans]|uniref:Amidohydrolase family protein n=1 Tax=Panacibacter ginsenosidivorans TaxID=1813871 RepID=A0A5B8VCD4_9BACT|nr:amidohydrolase family protein [Panacibacter ginsenosidivorans]QEC68346.1 amidohydrolase family protein [Panacibacter ginsenosidivorans]